MKRFRNLAPRWILTGAIVVCWAAPIPAEEVALQPVPGMTTPPPPGGNAGAVNPLDIPPISPALKPELKPPKPFPNVPPVADTPFGDHPHFGTPEDAGQGYLHFELFNNRYGLWYRPRAHLWGLEERCSPGPFRPRGYGDLSKDPSSCYRMDYRRYTVENYRSDFGPAYYRRQGDQRCDYLDFCEKHRRLRCEERTSVWTLSDHLHDK